MTSHNENEKAMCAAEPLPSSGESEGRSTSLCQPLRGGSPLNEDSAIQSLRDYHLAQSQFRPTDWYSITDNVYANVTNSVLVGNTGYPDLFETGNPVIGTPNLISAAFAAADIDGGNQALNGFVFNDITDHWSTGAYDFHTQHGLCAAPDAYMLAGWNCFIIDASGAIYQAYVESISPGTPKGQQVAPLTTHPDASMGWILVEAGDTLVSIVASVPAAAEPTTDGEFTFMRTGDLTDPLDVEVLVGGSATAGADYAAIPSPVTIPGGQASVTVTVSVTDDIVAEAAETVVIAIIADVDYEVAVPSMATVTIADDGD